MLMLHHPQSGRSMVEMLGTLAIVGVLSAGAIGGYSYAMNKHRTNELIYEATKRAQWVGTQLEMNNPNPSLNTFGTDSFGGGTFTGEVVQLENGQIGIKVAGLKEAVCQNILNSIGDNTVIREMKDVNCNNDNGTATLVFNRDLSTSDPTDIPEVSGEASGQASTASEVTATEASDRKLHCNDHGDWDGNSCDCDAGFEGESCNIEINAQPDEPAATATTTAVATVTVGYEPEETAKATVDNNHPCSGNGTWYEWLNNNSGGCRCDVGWDGSNCSEDKRNACGEHGVWNPNGSYCHCDSGYGGSDCSQDSRTACNNNGTWDGGQCDCDSGYGGVNCSVQNPCDVHRVWIVDTSKPNGGFCECDSVWGGDDCSEDLRAPCNDHGTWGIYSNQCSCDNGWAGSDCSKCNGHGYYWNANTQECGCYSGWCGSNCTIDHSCNEHGSWNGSSCSCYTGYVGFDCSQNLREACNNHGTWMIDTGKPNGGFCECDMGYGGSDCSQSSRMACNNSGTWIIDTSKPNGGYCSCDTGYTGSDCSTPN